MSMSSIGCRGPRRDFGRTIGRRDSTRSAGGPHRRPIRAVAADGDAAGRARAPEVRLYVDGPSVETIAVGDFVAPTEPDGELRIYYFQTGCPSLRFRHRRPRRQGRPARLQQKLVLIGTSRPRDGRLSEHAAGRAHAWQRNPGAVAGESLRPDLAHAAVVGGTAGARSVRAFGLSLDLGHAAMEARPRGTAGAWLRWRCRLRRYRRIRLAQAAVRRGSTRSRPAASCSASCSC